MRMVSHVNISTNYFNTPMKTYFVLWYKDDAVYRKNHAAVMEVCYQNNFFERKIKYWYNFFKFTYNGKYNATVENEYDITYIWYGKNKWVEGTNKWIDGIAFHDHHFNNVHRSEGPALITVSKTHCGAYKKIWRQNNEYCREYGPSVINLAILHQPQRSWVHNAIDQSREIAEWLKENNIVLSEENDFEIPDEYKVEFRLRFR